MNPKIIALLCLVGCGSAKTTSPATPEVKSKTEDSVEKENTAMEEAKWECFYLDGSGNQFHFYRKEGAIHFRYDPIQPAMSSSGVYSGGTAKDGVLTSEQASMLVSQVQNWQENTVAHVERRSKGVSSFRVAKGEGDRLFLVPESQLTELNALLKPLRP